MSTSNAIAELDKIVELFSSTELPDVCAKALIDSMEKPSSKWSLGNQILMILNNTTDARGFRQWQEMGRYVKKGSHAMYILAPMVIQKKEKIINTLTREEREEKTPQIIGFKSVPVFRVEDTEGKDLPEYIPRDVPPLLDVAESWGLSVKYEAILGEYGHYSYARKEIVLGSEAWDVYFHELGHAGHAKIEKLDLKDIHQGEREAIAQLTAAVLSRMYGRGADGFSWNYIAHYAEEKKPEAVGRLCVRVLSKVQKIVNLIFETKELVAPTLGQEVKA